LTISAPIPLCPPVITAVLDLSGGHSESVHSTVCRKPLRYRGAKRLGIEGWNIDLWKLIAVGSYGGRDRAIQQPEFMTLLGVGIDTGLCLLFVCCWGRVWLGGEGPYSGRPKWFRMPCSAAIWTECRGACEMGPHEGRKGSPRRYH